MARTPRRSTPRETPRTSGTDLRNAAAAIPLAIALMGTAGFPPKTSEGSIPPPRTITHAAQPQLSANEPSTIESKRFDPGELQVHVINVGQGDAVLVRCPDGDHELLIDAADTRYPGSGQAFRSYLAANQDPSNGLEVVVASHPHADHIGQMAWVLDNYNVDLYVDNGEVSKTATSKHIDEEISDRGIRYWSAQDELVPEIDFCPREDVTARVLRPSGFGQFSNTNDNSVVVRVDYGESSFLFVGDTEEAEEQLLLNDVQTADLLDCDFLKAGHHGSNTSSTDEFLKKVSPHIAAVSCGAKGVGTNARYRHPRLERLKAMLSQAAPREGDDITVDAFDTERDTWRKLNLDRAVYTTASSGDLVFESNGRRIRLDH
jgi:competence protein ComEC